MMPEQGESELCKVSYRGGYPMDHLNNLVQRDLFNAISITERFDSYKKSKSIKLQ